VNLHRRYAWRVVRKKGRPKVPFMVASSADVVLNHANTDGSAQARGGRGEEW